MEKKRKNLLTVYTEYSENYKHILIYSSLSYASPIQYKMIIGDWISHNQSQYTTYLDVIKDINNNKRIYISLNLDQEQINNLTKIIGQRNKLNMLRSYV